MNQRWMPIAIGGIGGSGTRMVAQFFKELDYYLGGDLNEANDNLWFTLLFKRRSILVEPRAEFESAAEAFFQRMGGGSISETVAQRLDALVTEARLQHSEEWLRARAASFCEADAEVVGDRRWVWKEPNTHIVVERLLEMAPRLRYIHVVRNGLDMAFSANQNQLQLWGAVFLNRDVTLTARDSLAYWCAAHRRMLNLARRFRDRIMFLDFDAFCRDPKPWCYKMSAFVGATENREAVEALAEKVIVPKTVGIFREKGLSEFDRGDLEFVRDCGYPVD